jgi:hypothetical protein
MKNVIRALALMVALAAPASSAFAGTVVVHHTVVRHVEPAVHVGVGVVTPTVRVGVAFDPWRPYAEPVVRPGYVWVPGHYAYGAWYPGYYRPVEARPGYAFEPGYWRGGVYVDGYWRPERVERQHWVPGYYTPGRGWVPGHWAC